MIFHINNLNLTDIYRSFLFTEILLQKNEKLINDLNVFPVPDGDTGSNMLSTIKAINQRLKPHSSENFSDIAKVIIESSLMGARGNSGVILSQFIGGFFDMLKERKEITPDLLSQAINNGKEWAYRSVSQPQEGTMLTIMRVISDKFTKLNTENENLVFVFRHMLKAAKKSLQETPTLLPLLKEAGVVDAGAAGFILLLEGTKQAFLLKNEKLVSDHFLDELNTNLNFKQLKNKNINPREKFKKLVFLLRFNVAYQVTKRTIIFFSRPFLGLARLFWNVGIKQVKTVLPALLKKPVHKHCFEVLLKNPTIDKYALEKMLQAYGDSLIIAGEQSLLKIHIHTDRPREMLYELDRICLVLHKRLSNLERKHEQFLEDSKIDEEGGVAMVTVSNGEGFNQILASQNVKTIEGGKTMNPSVETILTAIENLTETDIIFFPSHKNLYLTAEGAAKICLKNMFLVYSPSIPQTISASINYNPELPIEHNLNLMNNIVAKSQMIKITHAVRESHYKGKEIQEGNFIVLNQDEILNSGSQLNKVALEGVAGLMNDEYELITIYTGEEVTEDQSQELKELLSKQFPAKEIQIYVGGQPLAFYLILLEK